MGALRTGLQTLGVLIWAGEKVQKLRQERWVTPRLYRVSPLERPGSFDVVFLHGIGGHAAWTWQQRPDDASTFWPRWVADDFEDARVLSVQYPTALTSLEATAAPDIKDVAEQLYGQLEIYGVGTRPVVFVCHSMGGLVCKHLLLHSEKAAARRALWASTAGILFLATPHNGSLLSRYLQATVERVTGVGSLQLKGLSYDDERLLELSSDFNTALSDSEAQPEFAVFYETANAPLVGQRVVERASAQGQWARIAKAPGTNVDHSEIAKLPDWSSRHENLVFSAVGRLIAVARSRVSETGEEPANHEKMAPISAALPEAHEIEDEQELDREPVERAAVPEPPASGNLLGDLLTALGPLVALAGGVFTKSVGEHYEIAMGSGKAVPVTDPGFAATVVNSSFTAPWRVPSLILLALLATGYAFLIAKRWGKMRLSPTDRMVDVGGGAIAVALLAAVAFVATALPKYNAGPEIEGLLQDLSFAGEYPRFTDRGPDPSSQRSGPPSRAAVLYSWLHGVELETSPDGELRVESTPDWEVPPQRRKDLRRRTSPSALEQCDRYFEDLAGGFVATFLLTLVAAVAIALFARRVRGRYLFALVLLLLTSVVVSSRQLYLTKVSYARIFLASQALKGYQSKSSIRDWPFSQLYLDAKDFKEAQRFGAPVPVSNFWPIRVAEVRVGVACTEPPRDFESWVWKGREVVAELPVPGRPRPRIAVDLVDTVREVCCGGSAGGTISRQVRISDGLGASEPEAIEVDCS